jgi:hypothetical protein
MGWARLAHLQGETVADSESPEEQFDLIDPAFFAAGASKAATARARAGLTEFEKLELADTEADIRMKLAQVREARSRAAAEPERQQMALTERETNRRIRIGLALFAPAFLTLALLLAPWVIPPTGIAAAFACLRRESRS